MQGSGLHPGRLLASGSLSGLKAGGWNAVAVKSVSVVSGSTYWLAVLGRGGVLYFRDRANGSCRSENSAQTSLSALPGSWSTGPVWDSCPISAYVTGSALAPSPVPPTGSGSTTTGTSTTGSTASTGTGTSTTGSTGSTGTETTGPVTTTIPGPPAPPSPTATPGNTAAPVVSGSTVQGQTLSTDNGSWTSTVTGYSYQWQDCSSSGAACTAISDATDAAYTLTASDIGSTIRSVVTATDAGGSTPASSAATATVAALSSSPAAAVGAPGPAVSCTTTLNPGQNVSNAVTSAAAGSVVCLNSDTWGNISIASSMNPATPVTLAAVPGSTVTIGNFSTDAQIENLTVQGFHASSFNVDAPSNGGITFQYDTVENVSKGIAFALFSDAHGTAPSQPIIGVTMRYNQVDHVGQCLADVYNQQDTSFSHNVCGPGIGYGDTSSTDPGHYIESGGEDDMTVDNNAFVGPAYSGDQHAGLHLNVMHLDGTSTDFHNDNNLIWHDDSIANTILIQEGQFTDINVDNNLIVGDPACMLSAPGGCVSNTIEVYAPHGLTVKANTVVNTPEGLYLGPTCSNGCFSSGNTMTVQQNVVAPIASVGGASDFSEWDCASACAADHNVTGDDSSDSVLTGSSDAIDWSPSFAGTSWTPTQPWTPAPTGYYQATGLPFQAGYQGQVGP